MNRLILIGNGFDLAHNLKTKYSDFVLWYLNTSVQSAASNNYYFEDDLLKIEYTRPINNVIKNYNTISELFEIIRLFEIKIKYKHQFFKNIVNAIELNWVDIESRYYSSLIELYRRLEKLNIDNNIHIDKELDGLNNCFENIKIKLIDYLSKIEKQSKIKDDEINNLLFDYFKISGKSNQHSLFLNFNYTSTIDMYLDSYKSSLLKVINIHGKLNDPKNPIIFGYGDEMDTYYERIERLNSNEFLRNIKSFWYFKTKNYQSLVRFIEDKPFNVYILGHSCGISDRILLNSLFEHVNCRQIKIFYHQRNKNENDYFEKTQEISRHFKSNTKAKMRNSIIPFTECSPLKQFK